MGCDIHTVLIARKKSGSTYIPINVTVEYGNGIKRNAEVPGYFRNYSTFGYLAYGVRGCGDEEISIPVKGRFEPDRLEASNEVNSFANDEVAAYYNDKYLHTHSYITRAEFYKLVDDVEKKYKKIKKQSKNKTDPDCYDYLDWAIELKGCRNTLRTMLTEIEYVIDQASLAGFMVDKDNDTRIDETDWILLISFDS